MNKNLTYSLSLSLYLFAGTHARVCNFVFVTDDLSQFWLNVYLYISIIILRSDIEKYYFCTGSVIVSYFEFFWRDIASFSTRWNMLSTAIYCTTI